MLQIAIAKRRSKDARVVLCSTMSAKGNNMQIQLAQNGIWEMQRERSEYRPGVF